VCVWWVRTSINNDSHHSEDEYLNKTADTLREEYQHCIETEDTQTGSEHVLHGATHVERLLLDDSGGYGRRTELTQPLRVQVIHFIQFIIF